MRITPKILMVGLVFLIVGCLGASEQDVIYAADDRGGCIVRFDLSGDLETPDAVRQVNEMISQMIGKQALAARYRIASIWYNPPYPEYAFRYAEECGKRHENTQELLEHLLQGIDPIKGYRIYERDYVDEEELVMTQGRRWGPP